MRSEQGKRILEAYNSKKLFEFDIKLRSNRKLVVNGDLYKIDTIYIVRDAYTSSISLAGYAHSDRGDYNWDFLTASEISNLDVSSYMDETRIINFNAFVEYLDENGMLY